MKLTLEELEFIIDTLKQTEEYGKNGYSYLLQTLLSKFNGIIASKQEELEYLKFQKMMNRYECQNNKVYVAQSDISENDDKIKIK